MAALLTYLCLVPLAVAPNAQSVPAPAKTPHPAAVDTVASSDSAPRTHDAPPSGTAARAQIATPSGTAPESFDPKVRRFGVQTLDEPRGASNEEPLRPDAEAPILADQGQDPPGPDTQGRALVHKKKDKCAANSAQDSPFENSDCNPKPTYKLGASVFMIPIHDSGLGGRQNQSLSRVHQRTRLSGALRWRSLGVTAQVQDVRTWGQGSNAGSTSDAINLALHQGYAELVGESKKRHYRSFFRVGRQAILWGEQRLMGGGEWTIHGRAFDAARAFVGIRNFEFDAFWATLRTRPMPGEPMEDEASHLAGLRVASHHLPYASAELFALFQRFDAAPPNDPSALTNIGLRVFGDPLDKLHYSLEANLQLGKLMGREHLAWASAGWLAWRQPLGGPLSLTAHAGISAASGQRDGPKSTEFFNFYPANHRNYGMIDLLGWRNMVDYEAQLRLSFSTHLDLGAAYHFFTLESAQGAWKNAGGIVIHPGREAGDPAPENRALASEVDLFVNYRPLKAFDLQLGYALWIPTQAGYERLGSQPGQRQAPERFFLRLKAQL